MKTRSADASAAPIRLGPFTLGLAFCDSCFTGLGDVVFDGMPLRAPRLPWTFYTESEKGFRFSEFDLLEVRQVADSVTIVFESEGAWLPRVQAADAMGDARIVTRRLHRPTARFEWTFRLIGECLFENDFSGLAMNLRVSSPGHPIHWIIEDTTWEIGGEASGTTLIQQDISTIDLEQSVEADSAFSTIEKFHTDGWGGAFPMDMLPRAAGAAICDFQTKGDLVILLFAENPSLTRARLEKFADENVIHYTDRMFFPLGENVKTPERKLLVHRHGNVLKRHEWRNLWLDCFVSVRSRILRNFGFEVETPRPRVSSHLWDADLKKLGSGWTEELKSALPEFHRLGYRDVFTHGVWDSITSDPAPAEKGNICCPYQFRYAESFGGNAGMKQLTDAARSAGVEIFQWFSFHLSKHAKIWKDHPDWVLREANGDPWDGNYGTLWSGRFLSEYGEWMRGQILETCRNAGLDGIFWDSYQNLGVTCVDWGASDKAPQADSIWKFQTELQRKGIRQLCEIITIFGVSAVAVYGFEDDKFRRSLWRDTVNNDDIFALMDTSPGFFTKQYAWTSGKLSPELYFWMVAHRVIPGIRAYPWASIRTEDSEHGVPLLPGGKFAEDYARVNHQFLAAEPYMKRLRLVEGATHTLWLDGDNQPAVIWGLKKGEAPYTGPARELDSGRKLDAPGSLLFERGEVWLLGER
jgi:hypothetical protein